MVKVRITIDIDHTNGLMLMNSLLRGIYFLHRFPDTIRQTSKGFHVIYYGLNVTEDKSYRLRFCLLDDFNRISLDLRSPRRLQQILFSEKIVKYYDVPKDYKCPVCGYKNIEQNTKYFTFDKKIFEVRHKNGVICTTRLKSFRKPIIITLLEKAGLTNAEKQ